MSSTYLLLGTAAGLEGGGGVDPETASDRTLILDSTAASTITSDIDGVALWEDKDQVAGHDVEQLTVADRPDEVTDGIQGDSTDDLTSLAGFTWGDIIDADAFTILMLMKTPPTFDTNDTGSGINNQMMMADVGGGALGFSFTRSAGTIGILVANDSAVFKKAERPAVVDTWFRVAMRLLAGNIGILLDDETSFTETDLDGTVFAGALARTIIMLANQSGAQRSLGILNILVAFDVGKTDEEVVDFMTFWAPRVPA